MKNIWQEYKILIIVVLIGGVVFWRMLPDPLFSDPLSTTVFDANDNLLGARIANDGQWRFPGLDSIPVKYATAVLAFEDRNFYRHPGVNPLSLLRAMYQNISSWEVKSGGSTITMQVIRMSKHNPPRTLYQKCIEILLALRLELSCNKEEVLLYYTNNAPFGGNVVGIEAAAWRYFGASPFDLTWAESALLAVLPNAPSLIHPGKNRNLLKVKRDRLLQYLYEEEIIDRLTWDMAIEEPLPDKPMPLSNSAPHLTDHVLVNQPGTRFYSTIRKHLQERVSEMTNMRQEGLAVNQIHNMACLVMEVETGNVLAYVGNSGKGMTSKNEGMVDIIRAPRSTGSILKPFLFAGMIDNGDILPATLIPDVPVRYHGYAPKNYNRDYNGAVPAYKALERSLNIPSVIMLNQYGVDAFLHLLRGMGFSSFMHSHEHYGLTLILGGGEVSLWELAGVYGSMARCLNQYLQSDGRYFSGDIHPPVVELVKRGTNQHVYQEEGILSAASIYLTFESLLEVNRPEELSNWYLLSSSRRIAWKTGTSYGNRDAWAVGVTPEYLVAVWAGNADGEGRPGLTGVTAAAPLMFDVFSLLPETSWFEKPLDELADAAICRHSGYLAGPHCEIIDTVEVVPKGLKSEVCPYHQTIHLDSKREYRVNSSCFPVHKMVTEKWFILPPLMEYYYRRSNPHYKPLPPIMKGCVAEDVKDLQIVYPEYDSHLVIPVELDGSKGSVVMEVAHRQADATVFWHLDQEFIASTKSDHKLALDLSPGKHSLTVMDEEGSKESVTFEVLDH